MGPPPYGAGLGGGPLDMLVIAAHTQPRLARPPVAARRRPREMVAAPNKPTPPGSSADSATSTRHAAGVS